jgi:hypothetical protein
MIYQNGSSSTDRAIHGTDVLKNSFTSEVEPCQMRPYRDGLGTFGGGGGLV